MGYLVLLLAVVIGVLMIYSGMPDRDTNNSKMDSDPDLLINVLDEAETAKSQLEGRSLSD